MFLDFTPLTGGIEGYTLLIAYLDKLQINLHSIGPGSLVVQAHTWVVTNGYVPWGM